MGNKTLKAVRLSDGQKAAVDSIITYDNYCLFSEGADGTMTVIVHASGSVLAQGLWDLAKNKDLLDIMTNIVIDAQTRRAE
jgi:hypothetical protein